MYGQNEKDLPSWRWQLVIIICFAQLFCNRNYYNQFLALCFSFPFRTADIHVILTYTNNFVDYLIPKGWHQGPETPDLVILCVHSWNNDIDLQYWLEQGTRLAEGDKSTYLQQELVFIDDNDNFSRHSNDIGESNEAFSQNPKQNGCKKVVRNSKIMRKQHITHFPGKSGQHFCLNFCRKS